MIIDKIQPTYIEMVKAIDILKNAFDISFFEALIKTCDNLLDGGKVQVVNGEPSETAQKELAELYAKIDLKQFDAEEMRQLFQLLLLKGFKEDKVPANYQMTPDTIGILITAIIREIFRPDEQGLTIFDPTVGTGNLLFTIVNQLKSLGYKDIIEYGVDNDDVMLTLASLNAKLEGQNIKLFHQDAIDDLHVPEPDIVIADLPVGYYPVDQKVDGYKTKNTAGHSYAHHVLIERSIRMIKYGHIGIFIVPANLFETKETTSLLSYIQSEGYLQAFLKLPTSLFGNKNSGKAILLFQRKGGLAKQAQNILLGDIPSFKDMDEFNKFMAELREWLKGNIFCE